MVSKITFCFYSYHFILSSYTHLQLSCWNRRLHSLGFYTANTRTQVAHAWSLLTLATCHFYEKSYICAKPTVLGLVTQVGYFFFSIATSKDAVINVKISGIFLLKLQADNKVKNIFSHTFFFGRLNSCSLQMLK